MENVPYMCYCRSIFQTINDFHSHKSHCEHYKGKSDTSTKLETMSVRSVPGIQIVEHNVGAKQDFIIKIMNSSAMVLDDEQELPRPERIATNLLGRRLPSRTKVPYLSRAVSLSADHSYERCPCGAVFVTRIGKRQHQARFCKFVKNKTKKWQTNCDQTENIQANPVTQLSPVSDFVEDEDCMISEELDIKTESEHSIIQIQEIM